MMFAKKKIVLNSAQSTNKHGVAEITRLDNYTQLSIKLNNFRPNENSGYVFLLKNNDLQQKITLTNPCDFSCDVNIPIDLNKKISCLLIESGAKQTPLFWGGTDTQTQIMSILDEENARHKLNLDKQQHTASLKEPTYVSPDIQTPPQQNTPNQFTDCNNIDATQNNDCQNDSTDCQNCPHFDQTDIENIVDDEMSKFELVKNYDEPNSPQCQNCKYKNVFYQEKDLNEAKLQLEKIAKLQNDELTYQNIQDTAQNMPYSVQNMQEADQNINFDINNNNNNNDEITEKTIDEEPYYYGLIKAQYDDMFSKYPTFSPLTNIIENSKWIEVDGVDDPYIMGIIYDDGKAKYLCYGVVQEKKQSPPIEIADSSQWVPFDITNEFGSGVWIMYQSADNGETIKVEVI